MMNQEDIFKKIGQILNELQDQYDFLAQNPQQLNELELELFLANANFLSDHVQIVRKINNNRVLKELPVHEEPIHKSIPVQAEIIQPLQEEVEEVQEVVQGLDTPHLEQIEKEELQQEDVPEIDNTMPSFEFILNEEPETDKFEFEERKSVVEMFNRPLSDEEQQIIAQKQKSTEEPAAKQEEESPAAEPFLKPSQPISFVPDKVEEKEVPAIPMETPVIDRVEEKIVQPPPLSIFESRVHEAPKTEEVPAPRVEEKPSPSSGIRPTLNELLAAKQSGSSAPANTGNEAKPAISDLKGAINLNEKLLYIKDLFNGYNLAYSEAIELINKMPDMKTADAFLKNNYAQKNNWEAKQTTVDKFYSLLKQRFPEA